MSCDDPHAVVENYNGSVSIHALYGTKFEAEQAQSRQEAREQKGSRRGGPVFELAIVPAASLATAQREDAIRQHLS